MLRHLMKFENWSDDCIPREVQLDVIDIMNDLKDDIDCRISYQWWSPYAKYDPHHKAGDKYPYIQITNIKYKYLKDYIKRIRTYLNDQGFNLTVRYDSSKNPYVSGGIQMMYRVSRRTNSKWKILNKEIDFLTDFRLEIINRDIYGKRHPDFKNSSDYTEFTENLSVNSDLQEIKDIINDLKDDWGLETRLNNMVNSKQILIQINGYFTKSNLLDTIEKFSKDLNDVFKRLENLYSKIELGHYSVNDIEYDGDGNTIELEDKFKVWINIYVNI